MVGNTCKWCVIDYKNSDGRKCEFTDIMYRCLLNWCMYRGFLEQMFNKEIIIKN